MSLIRTLLTALFAIMIANPACCCVVEGVSGSSTPVDRCCSGGGEDRQQHSPDEPCVCATHLVKQVEDPPVIPGFVPVELPPLVVSFALPDIGQVPVRHEAAPGIRNDTGPPRSLLIRFQRFLI